jgi:Fe2+ transport system protein B
MSITSLLAACAGPFVVTYMRSKTIFMVGYVSCSILLLVITILFAADHDQTAFYFIILLVFI